LKGAILLEEGKLEVF